MKSKDLCIGAGVVVGSIVGGAILLSKYRKTIPKGVAAVTPFDLSRYLGKWYEIARFDSFFEYDMDYVTAEYSMNEDGSVRVTNRGYNNKKHRFQESVGRAIFVGDENIGMFNVSFFSIFYSGYNIIALDNDYKYALVSGRNRNYLWILSREQDMPQDILEDFLEIGENLGYDISDLVWTAQDRL